MPPSRPLLAFAVLAVVAACDAFEDIPDFEPLPRNCDTRVAYWLDGDGDGVGGDAEVYLGCEALDGYVEAAGDCDDADPALTTGCDTGAPDTGAPDTGTDTGADTGIDTGPADTGTDTGAPDTGTDTGTDTGASPDTGTDTSDTSDTSSDTSGGDTG
jgi:hypothetical protein